LPSVPPCLRERPSRRQQHKSDRAEPLA
jgi:hypothetical protein